MRTASHIAVCVLFAGLAAGCQQQPADSADDTGAGARTPQDVDPPVAAADAATSYRCIDGSELRIAYAAEGATVTLPDGRTVALPRAESASQGSGGAYVGEALGLDLEGDRVFLHQDEGPTLECVRP
ncbi:hypothetical protein H0E84_18130 [Luteimonas sp. SJ-92]|uniref:C-type lysozyme inhibitor domain-containing protein n=1 Tax=Luteimonas salinisoli TaxID=2752307 RepID=A0A853JID3_9GAMM|nr:hypothetical protein [Luteimonas salinisoli]NZA28297.1 hypothetical protein [Luteimonas salinisoli]